MIGTKTPLVSRALADDVAEPFACERVNIYALLSHSIAGLNRSLGALAPPRNAVHELWTLDFTSGSKLRSSVCDKCGNTKTLEGSSRSLA